MPLKPSAINHKFANKIICWFDEFGRHDLPWQNTQDPYQIWVSEIMLQQTQVKTVIPFYTRFMARFPDISSLASAEQDEVLHHWTGLGYYARARNLHKATQMIVSQHGGIFPTKFDDVIELSGIGRSTAGAILSFAFSQRHAILDGNVKRVLSRCFGVAGWPGGKAVSNELWDIAEACTPAEAVAKYTQAIMDFGATLCTRSKPNCDNCPLQTDCIALNTQQIANFPGKKPKKSIPTKTSTMLVLKNQRSEILLIQRPPTGIWGGLWSLPELEFNGVENTLEQTINAFIGNEVKVDSLGNAFKHTFSHFHLDITPVYASIDKQLSNTVFDQATVWYDPKEPLQIGLAAPIKQLLHSL